MSAEGPALPRPTTADEDRYIADLAGQDPTVVADGVRAALAAGRPSLAARAVGLLGDTGDDDPELDRARGAARFLVMQGGPGAQVEEALDDLLGRLRGQRMAQARRRQRDKLRERPRDPTTRRPRK